MHNNRDAYDVASHCKRSEGLSSAECLEVARELIVLANCFDSRVMDLLDSWIYDRRQKEIQRT